MWQCPLCNAPISLTTTPIKCQHGHSFDKAKVGYVNLLPVQFKKSKSPGDDKAMVRARREFHNLNAYKPLKDKMLHLISDAVKNRVSDSPLHVYDAGCGEGSYLNALCEGLANEKVNVKGAGSDISKIAVELAAKAFKSHEFVVASSFELPVADNALDVMLQVFAPGSNDEYNRVLKNNGLLLTVNPAQDHLFEVKTKVYDAPRKHTLDESPRDGFELLHNEILTFSIPFKSEEHALALIKMTPFYWKLPPGRIDEMVKALKSVTADFHLQLWKKCGE